MGTDQKIKVCHLISGDLWAGAEVQAYTMLKSLYRHNDLDLQAIILNEGKLAEKLRLTGMRVTIIDESRNGFFTILRKLKRKLKNENIDILHSHRSKEISWEACLKEAAWLII